MDDPFQQLLRHKSYGAKMAFGHFQFLEFGYFPVGQSIYGVAMGDTSNNGKSTDHTGAGEVGFSMIRSVVV